MSDMGLYIKKRKNLPQRDDDKLGIFRAILDVVGNNRDVPEVQSCIDFIHEVQWSRLRRNISQTSIGA